MQLEKRFSNFNRHQGHLLGPRLILDVEAENLPGLLVFSLSYVDSCEKGSILN